MERNRREGRAVRIAVGQIVHSSHQIGFSERVARRSRGMGRGGGVGMGGVGISLPGMGGMGRRGGMGSPGGGGGYPGCGQNRRNPDSAAPPTLTMRWESAMPVRSAELRVHDSAAPTLNGKHYAIAVYGIPTCLLPGD